MNEANAVTVRDVVTALRNNVEQRAASWLMKRVDMDRFIEGDPWETSPEDDYAHAHGSFRIHPWVYSAVRICSQSGAKIPIVVYRETIRNDDVTQTAAPGHRVAQLLNNPNPNMSRYRLIESAIAFRKLDGNAYWMLVRKTDNGPVDMIIPLRPDLVKVAKNDTGKIVGYVYTNHSEEMPIEVRDIIHHKQFSATSDTFGQGDLQAARNTILDDMEARIYNFNFWKNSAIPRGGLATEQPVNNNEFTRISKRWYAAHKGSQYSHRVAILEKGLKWVDIGMKPTDMDFISRFANNRNEVGSVFGVPPIKMNDHGSGKWNTETQERQFMHDTIIPQLIEITDTINLNMWKIEGRASIIIEPIKVKPDFSKNPSLRRERLEMEKADNESVKYGLRTINEIRQHRNEEPVEWGDTYWKPANLVDVKTGAPGISLVSPSAQEKVSASAPNNDVRLITSITPEDVRSAIWAGYWVKQFALERLVQNFTVRLFNVQRDIMLARLAAFDKQQLTATAKRPPRSEWEIETILFDLEESIEKTGSKYGKISEVMIREGGQRGIELAQVASTFDQQDPNVTAFVNEHRNRYAKKVNTTTWKNMRGELAKLAKEGASTVDMANSIDTYMSRRRADKFRIARTETNSALNGGLIRGYKQSDVVETKLWVNAGDKHVRDSHWLTEVEVPIDQTFMLDNGVHLNHPGDPAGPVEEIVECRCTTAPGIRKKD